MQDQSEIKMAKVLHRQLENSVMEMFLASAISDLQAVLDDVVAAGNDLITQDNVNFAYLKKASMNVAAAKELLE